MIKENLTPLEALSYLDDIAHGRKMEFDPHELVEIIKPHLKASEILKIIFDAPSIINQLFELGELGKDATQRYFWGTISDADVKKVKEFFADGKMQ